MAKVNVKGLVRKILIGLLIALVVIQFFRPGKNNNPTITDKDITRLYTVPDSVQQILAKACNDCHSDNTRYPWYNNIQPVAWWLNDHIKDGKKEMNLSEFGNRPLVKQAKKLKKCAKEIEEGEMPLDSYTWIHKDAVLTPAEKQMLINWARGLSDQISAQLPPSQQAPSQPGH